MKNRKPFAFVAGSAQLDVIADSAEPFGVFDRVGNTAVGFGGVGYNISVNLRVLGVDVTLMSAMNDGPISQMIRSELAACGVRSHILIKENLPDSIYCGHFEDGIEKTFVCNNTDQYATFDQEFIAKGMNGAACVVANCSLNIESFNALVAQANAQDIPVFVSGVSPRMTARLTRCAGRLDYVFLNEPETDCLCAAMDVASEAELAPRFNAVFVITRGARGVSVYQPDGRVHDVDVQKLSVPGNALGSGDLFMASTIFHHFHKGMPLEEALRASFAHAGQILARHDANIGRSNPLAANIGAAIEKAHIDHLTRVMNRHGLEHYLAGRDLERERIYAILVDIDHFKQINDRYGHQVGDDVLRSVASVLKENIRYGDVVGRFGGEEFVCLLTGIGRNIAMEVAERMRADIQSRRHGKENVEVTVSIGVSDVADHTENEEIHLHVPSGNAHLRVSEPATPGWEDEKPLARPHWFASADAALYKAKSTGRNRVMLAEHLCA